MQRRQTGFTLIELMIVVAIIAIILAMAIPNLQRSRISAAETAAVGGLRTLFSDLGLYRSRFGGWPANFDDLQAVGYAAGGFLPAAGDLFRSKGDYMYEYHPNNSTMGGEWFMTAFQLDLEYRSFIVNGAGALFVLNLAQGGTVTKFDAGR